MTIQIGSIVYRPHVASEIYGIVYEIQNTWLYVYTFDSLKKAKTHNRLDFNLSIQIIWEKTSIEDTGEINNFVVLEHI